MNKKLQLWGRYIGYWVATIMLGIGSWGIGQQAGVSVEWNHKAVVVVSMVSGILGTLCYFMLWTLFTPIVKWCWGRIRHNSRTFTDVLAVK